MRLAQLNAAIDAAPKIFAPTRFGDVEFKKGSFKAALAAHFGGRRSAETGVRLDAGNRIVTDASL